MKKIITLLGCSLFLVAGTAAAGCQYGPDGKHAASPLIDSQIASQIEGETPADPKLLALLKKQEAEALAKDASLPVFN